MNLMFLIFGLFSQAQVDFSKEFNCSLHIALTNGESLKSELNFSGPQNVYEGEKIIEIGNKEYRFFVFFAGVTPNHGHNRFSTYLFGEDGAIAGANGQAEIEKPISVFARGQDEIRSLNIICRLQTELISD